MSETLHKEVPDAANLLLNYCKVFNSISKLYTKFGARVTLTRMECSVNAKQKQIINLYD